jgi:Ca2+-binding EF-hand superfamily protein
MAIILWRESRMNSKHILYRYLSNASLAWILIFSIHCAKQQTATRGPHIEGGESGIQFMNKFDLNKDGKISHDEWEAIKPSTVYRQKHWPEYDINKDSYITLNEVPEIGGKSEPPPSEGKNTILAANQAAFIAKFDKDQDGKLSKKEFTGKHFDVYDKNGDGFIELEEAPELATAY